MVCRYVMRMHGRGFVRMHVGARRIAVLGMLTALSILLVYMGSILESSTFFFLAIASYGVGIANREYQRRWMVAYAIASVLLSFLVAPNKLYCCTFAGMSLYMVLTELLWEWIAERKEMQHKNLILWILKYVIFNLMYIPVILFLPNLIFTGEVSKTYLYLALLVGQAALFLYDKAYHYIQAEVWSKLRKGLQR